MEKTILIISNNLLEKEKVDFMEDLKNIFDIKDFKEEEIKNSIEYMKEFKFYDTFILLSDNIKNEFIEELNLNLDELKIIPKIFTLTNNHANIELYKEFKNYGEGNIGQIKNYLLDLMEKRKKKKKEVMKLMEERNKKNENENEKKKIKMNKIIL